MRSADRVLLDLLCELHTYYNDASDTPSSNLLRTHLVRNLLGPDASHLLVLASRADGVVLGLAAISIVFSLVEFDPGKYKQCQLKELYVGSSARNQGIGRALISWVARYARENGCHRVDWPVKAANTKGIAFYERLGAEQVVDRLSYRLTELKLSQLADEKVQT